MDNTYYPGTRVIVFDTRLYIDDKKTPPSITMRPATVICWYGCKGESGIVKGYRYPSLVDVRFDHRPNEISKGHFTDYMQVINEGENV